jgi:hypothetical protein
MLDCHPGYHQQSHVQHSILANLCKYTVSGATSADSHQLVLVLAAELPHTVCLIAVNAILDCLSFA